MRKTELAPAFMVRAPVVTRKNGLAIDPILPVALRVRSAALIAVPVRVVKIDPACAVRMRLAPTRVIGEVIFMAPVVCTRERAPAVPERGR